MNTSERVGKGDEMALESKNLEQLIRKPLLLLPPLALKTFCAFCLLIEHEHEEEDLLERRNSHALSYFGHFFIRLFFHIFC